MAPTRQTYTATLHLLVDAQLPADATFLSQPVPLACNTGTLTVTVSSERSTRVEIRWVFEEYFQEASGQDWDEKSWELWERTGFLILPDQDGNVNFSKDIDVGELLFQSCLSYLAMLSLVSRAPHFWSCLRKAGLRELQGDIWVEVAGHKVKLKPQAWRMQPSVHPASLSLAQATMLASSNFPAHANFLLTADRRFFEGDVADAVVHLAQAVEVAAYAYVRATGVTTLVDWSFSARSLFGPPPHRQAEIQQRNNMPLHRYADLCELFGARHEWIHEGRRKVRPFDPRTQTAPRNSPNARDLKREDYYTFRKAASEALTWMGYWPIE